MLIRLIRRLKKRMAREEGMNVGALEDYHRHSRTDVKEIFSGIVKLVLLFAIIYFAVQGNYWPLLLLFFL